jgi:hypothetical protein
VRLLDGTDGKPITRFWITLRVPKGDKRANRWVDKTDSKGVVSFPLTDPIPDSISPILGNEAYLCSDVTFSTDQILKTGIVPIINARTPASISTAARGPGELVVFAKRVSLWERIKREL